MTAKLQIIAQVFVSLKCKIAPAYIRDRQVFGGGFNHFGECVCSLKMRKLII